MKKACACLPVFFLFTLCIPVASAQDTDPWFIRFHDANTRPTYNSFHHILEAQKQATGKGVKAGIIDMYFGMKHNPGLYSGGESFTGDFKALEEMDEHGLWMAITLREIAPAVEIYALNARNRDRDIEAKAIVEAIDWAIDNGLDILTYSAGSFREQDRESIDMAVRKAVDNGIVIIFIHYDLEENILPYGFLSPAHQPYSREHDVNVFHYDYNVLLMEDYKNLMENEFKPLPRLSDHPYLSFSSMSVVLAGIIAMMKEINNHLSPADYKRILIESSEERVYEGIRVKHSVNAMNALNQLQNHPRQP